VSQRAGRRPVSALALLQQEASALFQRLSLLDRGERLPGGEWCPAVDVFEAHEQLVAVVEVPGVAPESLRIAFRERVLVVSGERNACHNRAGVSFLCLERPHGRFERTIPLEGPLDVSRARATLGRGLLRVSVPRLRERRGREHVVPVERESE
jgi:HSP20 family protein